MSFTICVFLYASLFATNPSEKSCREKLSQFDVDRAKAECEAVAKDPLMTCDMYRLSEDKYVVAIRKVDGT